MQCRDLNIPQKSYSIPILLLWFYTDNSQRWWLSLTERMRRARNEIIDRLRAQWAERAWKQGMILNMRWNTAGVLGRGWKWMKGDKMNENGKMDESGWKWVKVDEIDFCYETVANDDVRNSWRICEHESFKENRPFSGDMMWCKI